MNVRVSKEFHWEMGHRLPYHETCRNVHGHSYRMVVEVDGEPDERGMVVDFGQISAVVKPILAQLDHSFMVDPDDHLMLDLLATSGLKATFVPFLSTAENIATWILGQVSSHLFRSHNVEEVTVRVYETATSAAEAQASRAKIH